MEIAIFTFKKKTMGSSSTLLYYSSRQNLLFPRCKTHFQKKNLIFIVISGIACPIEHHA
jgi:hypothetical protein